LLMAWIHVREPVCATCLSHPLFADLIDFIFECLIACY